MLREESGEAAAGENKQMTKEQMKSFEEAAMTDGNPSGLTPHYVRYALKSPQMGATMVVYLADDVAAEVTVLRMTLASKNREIKGLRDRIDWLQQVPRSAEQQVIDMQRMEIDLLLAACGHRCGTVVNGGAE